MDLILWRHCDAGPGVPDEARHLTPRGLKQAARVAEWLQRHLPDTCRILVSPAARAQETAQALHRPFRTVQAIGAGASVAAVLAAANWPDAREPVLVVAHQPTLGRVASMLLADEETDRAMRKGAVWWLSNRPREEGAAVVLKVAIGPDFI
ncbi:MAG: histidine phosphatase family protein [Pseudomonadota bacterium]|nr:histidine phosphatase family protein [Pseudomonadota bacterium]